MIMYRKPSSIGIFFWSFISEWSLNSHQLTSTREFQHCLSDQKPIQVFEHGLLLLFYSYLNITVLPKNCFSLINVTSLLCLLCLTVTSTDQPFTVKLP